MEVVFAVFILISLLLYFLPGVIASQRAHRNQGAIWLINLLLGWTFLGWIAVLVWAMTSDQEPSLDTSSRVSGEDWSGAEPHAGADGTDERIECPECAELIKKKARKCRYCGVLLSESPSGEVGGPEVDDSELERLALRSRSEAREKGDWEA